MSATLKRFLLACCALCCLSVATAAEILVRYPMGASPDDFRYAYPVRVLQLALDKTAAEYGAARAVMGAGGMTRARVIAELARGEQLDVFSSGYSRELEERFLPVPICIHKGILGIRLFLIDEKRQAQFAAIRSVDELKQYALGQGEDWIDTAILRGNGFKLVTTNDYARLFEMLARGRFDLFPRAVYEPSRELQQFAAQAPGLAVEKTLALYYPNPDYFWVNKGNAALAERLRKGLEAAIGDGSFEALFTSEFGESIRSARLDQRLMLSIRNPIVDHLPHAGDPKYWLIDQLRTAGKPRFTP